MVRESKANEEGNFIEKIIQHVLMLCRYKMYCIAHENNVT